MASLGRCVRTGYYVASALEQNAWLAPLRPLPEFQALVVEALAHHRRAVDAYAAADGPQVLGVPARTQATTVIRGAGPSSSPALRRTTED